MTKRSPRVAQGFSAGENLLQFALDLDESVMPKANKKEIQVFLSEDRLLPNIAFESKRAYFESLNLDAR